MLCLLLQGPSPLAWQSATPLPPAAQPELPWWLWSARPRLPPTPGPPPTPFRRWGYLSHAQCCWHGAVGPLVCIMPSSCGSSLEGSQCHPPTSLTWLQGLWRAICARPRAAAEVLAAASSANATVAQSAAAAVDQAAGTQLGLHCLQLLWPGLDGLGVTLPACSSWQCLAALHCQPWLRTRPGGAAFAGQCCDATLQAMTGALGCATGQRAHCM